MVIDAFIDRRDTTIESHGIAFRSGVVAIEIFNIYIAPVTSCLDGYSSDDI